MVLQTPKSTLYIGNIDWSVKKQALRRALYMLFSRHGKIIDIVALRSQGLRGQAWIIYEDIASATAALREENLCKFYGRELKIEYARETSDLVARLDGTFIPKSKRQKTRSGEGDGESDEYDTKESKSDGEDLQASSQKKLKLEEQPPSNILFAQDLPPECNSMMLSMLFRQYAGFKECRIPRAGVAFIEFENEAQATVAKKNLDGFKLTAEDSLILMYGKK